MQTARAPMHGFVGLLALCGCVPVDASASNAAGAGATSVGHSGVPCLEVATVVSDSEQTRLGFRPADVERWLSGQRSAAFTWASGKTTWMRLTIGSPTAYYVDSRANPDFDADYSEVRCTDHLRLEGSLAFRTDDQQLDESAASFTLIAYGPEEARGALEFASGALHGSYTPALSSTHCWVNTKIRILFSAEGTHGSVVDSLRADKCDSEKPRPPEDFAVGHWGSRWQNY